MTPPPRDLTKLLQDGLEHLKLGRLAPAEAAFVRLLDLHPGEPNAMHFLGVVRLRQVRPAEAEALFRQALQALPHAGGVHNNLGNALRLQNRLPEAIEAYQTALTQEPKLVDARINLGRLLWERGDVEHALEVLGEGMRLLPGEADIGSLRAHMLGRCGRISEALPAHERALALNPALPVAWSTYASTLLAAGKTEPARQAFSRSLELNPQSQTALTNLLFCHHYLGDLPPAAQFELHREWARRFLPRVEAAAWPAAGDPERRLRVAYLSPDFREHSVAKFVEPLLEAHDPAQVEVIAYHCAMRPPDATTLRLKARTALWREVHALPLPQLAECIRQDRVDILVELAGHTNGSRLGVVAWRPAPVQVLWLGYPGTSGVDAFQARFTDALVDPPGEEALSAEPPCRLPRGFHCFRPDPESPEVSDLPVRASGVFTFGSFNAQCKHSPALLRCWAALLRRVPGSRLLMKAAALNDPYCQDRLREAFEAEGVAPERLELGTATDSKIDHLACYHRVDLALDTFPYNGVTTTCEALWMGVPVLTLRGDRPAARYGSSLLTQAGLEEFIAEDLDGYLRLAQRWAGDPEALAQLRQGMRARLRASALLDAQGFARSVEAAYRQLWRQACGVGHR